jgi:hypothetical protein
MGVVRDLDSVDGAMGYAAGDLHPTEAFVAALPAQRSGLDLGELLVVACQPLVRLETVAPAWETRSAEWTSHTTARTALCTGS